MQNSASPLPLKPASVKDSLMTYVFAIVVMLAVQVFSSVLMSVVLFASGNDLSQNIYVNLLFMVLIQGAYFFVAYFFIARKNLKITYSLKERPQLFSSLLAVPLAILCLAAFIGLQFLFAKLLETINYTFHPMVFTSPLQIVLGTIVVVLIAPVTEELIFRGILLSGLKKMFKTPVAVLLSGLAFSLMHMNPEQTVYQFFLGCLCAYAVIASGRLLPAVIIHATSNLLAILMDYTALGKILEYFLAALNTNLAVSILLPLGIAAVGCVALFYLVKLMRIFRKKDETRVAPAEKETTAGISPSEEKSKNKKITLLCLAAGLVPCVFMWITVFLSSLLTAV